MIIEKAIEKINAEMQKNPDETTSEKYGWARVLDYIGVEY